MARVFTPATGDNLRQRQATACRLLAVLVHGYLLGQILGVARLRAFFVNLYGPIRPRAVQLRVTQAQAAALFRAARRCAAWSPLSRASWSTAMPRAMATDSMGLS
jgi:hypothetical protein